MAVQRARSAHSGTRLQRQSDNGPRLIEISDEAYKQNTVYRPWAEIIEGIAHAAPLTSARHARHAQTSVRGR